jgi:predicted nucleic acid-binding protein
MPRVLLDTNIWLDFLEANRTNHSLVESLISELYDQDYELCIVATSIKDIYCILTRHLSEKQARSCVGVLLKTTTLLTVDATVLEGAYSSSEPDLEDGIIRVCAEGSNIVFLITRDREGFKDLEVLKVEPSEMLEILKATKTTDTLNSN